MLRISMAGERAGLMPTDPPTLNYTGKPSAELRYAGVKRAEGASTKHWDTYTDHESAVGSTNDFLSCRHRLCALQTAPFVYPVVRHDAHDVVLEAWRATGLLPTR